MEYSSPLVGSSTSTSEGAASGGVSEPTRGDHVALDVSEGRELQNLPADDETHSHSYREASSGNGTARGNGKRQISEAKKTENLAETQIRGLLWLEEPGNEVYAKAHKTWEAQDALFASRIDKKKKQSNSLRNEIYQLFGFYSVFQGVLLTAVAQSNYLHCHNWWTAFFLSLLASLVTIGGIIQKFLAILALEKTIKNEADTRQVVYSYNYQSMVTTTFVNKTTTDFNLKEGNAGVYRDLAVLKGVEADGEPRRPDGQFTVPLDVHATYWEYTGVAQAKKPKKSRIWVSSDMCQDNSVINIIWNNAAGKYDTECEIRKKPGDRSRNSNGGQNGGKLTGFVNFFKNLGK